MAYYSGVGDYYRGDYYRGDPFLGGLIAKGAAFLGKKVLPKVLPAAAKFIFGANPLTKGSQIITRPLGRAVSAAATAATIVGGVQAVRGIAGGGGGGLPTLPGLGGLPPIPSFGPGGPRMQMGAMNGACPPGFHPDKATGTKCVRNRRMNPANPAALRRAIRREAGFIKLARRTLKGTGVVIGRRSVGKKKGRR